MHVLPQRYRFQKNIKIKKYCSKRKLYEIVFLISNAPIKKGDSSVNQGLQTHNMGVAKMLYKDMHNMTD